MRCLGILLHFECCPFILIQHQQVRESLNVIRISLENHRSRIAALKLFDELCLKHTLFHFEQPFRTKKKRKRGYPKMNISLFYYRGSIFYAPYGYPKTVYIAKARSLKFFLLFSARAIARSIDDLLCRW